MSPTEFNIIVQSILSLLVLVVIVFALWPNQRVDLFRQQMFALRDELFDYAMNGHIAFDSPAYQLLRNLMNGIIRYAHNLSFYRSTLLQWKYQNDYTRKPWSEAWEHALQQIADKDTKRQMEEFHSRAKMLVVSQMVLNPGLVILFLPTIVLLIMLYPPWVTLRDIYNGVKNRVPMALLEEEAANS